MCVIVLLLGCVCMNFCPCLYGGCKCLRVCMDVVLYGGCVVFVCVSGHVCMVIVGVCLGICMFVDVCGCMVIVLRLYVYLAMFVW